MYIAYYNQLITNNSYPGYIKFLNYCKNKSESMPIIFCDSYLCDIKHDIPIFHSFYIRQKFKDYLIIVDFLNIKYLENYLLDNKKIIVIYNKLSDDISEIKNKYNCIEINEDIKI